jgi:hypothetical protein
MKTPMVVLLLVVVAGASAIITYVVNHAGEKQCQTVFCLKIPKGTRAHLKKSDDAVGHFETLLNTVDKNGNNGTKVNIRQEDGSQAEGPKNQWQPPPQLEPDGMVHATYQINTNDPAALKDVLDSFE